MKSTSYRPLTNNTGAKLVALSVTVLVLIIGYVFLQSRAAGFFASVEPASATVAGNAQIITDNGGKVIQFTAPATTPPPTTPPPSGGATTTCPLPKYPDGTCTGVPAGTSLTSKSGVIEVRTANTVIENLDLNGCIGVMAPGVIIRKSKITCTDGDAIVYNGEGGGRLLVEDVEITCNGKQGTAIVHSNYTARRLNVHDCENGFKMAHDVTLEDSYIHDMISYNSATDPHIDGIESTEGSRLTINHNTIFGTNSAGSIGNSAININNKGAHTSVDTVISNNLLGGGGYTLACPASPTTNFRITGNHFTTRFSSKVGLYGEADECASNEIKSGNVFHESGVAASLL